MHLFLEDELDGILLELRVQRAALLEVFPHYPAVFGIDPFDLQVRQLLEAGVGCVGIIFIIIRLVR